MTYKEFKDLFAAEKRERYLQLKLIKACEDNGTPIMFGLDGEIYALDEIEEIPAPVKDLSAKRKALEEAEADLYKWHRHLKDCDEKDNWFVMWIIESKQEAVDKLQKSIQYMKNNKQGYDIEALKQIPIGAMLGEAVYRSSSRNAYKCPLHNEKTGSFYWFKDKNNYHCFGCGAHGDAINLYQNLHKCSFTDACEALKYYI